MFLIPMLVLITVWGLSFFAILPIGRIAEKAERWINSLPVPLRIPLNVVYRVVVMLFGAYFAQALILLVASPALWIVWLLFTPKQ